MVVGVSGGGVLAAVVVVEVEAILFFEMFKILTRLDSGLIDGYVVVMTGSRTSWSCFTNKAKSTICKSYKIIFSQ